MNHLFAKVLKTKILYRFIYHDIVFSVILLVKSYYFHVSEILFQMLPIITSY